MVLLLAEEELVVATAAFAEEIIMPRISDSRSFMELAPMFVESVGELEER